MSSIPNECKHLCGREYGVKGFIFPQSLADQTKNEFAFLILLNDIHIRELT